MSTPRVAALNRLETSLQSQVSECRTRGKRARFVRIIRLDPNVHEDQCLHFKSLFAYWKNRPYPSRGAVCNPAPTGQWGNSCEAVQAAHATGNDFRFASDVMWHSPQCGFREVRGNHVTFDLTGSPDATVPVDEIRLVQRLDQPNILYRILNCDVQLLDATGREVVWSRRIDSIQPAYSFTV